MNRSTVAIILGAELRAWRNRISRGNRARIVGVAIFGSGAAFILGGTLFAVAFATGHSLPSARDPVLDGAFTALSVLMLVVGFPTVIATYFAGRDLMQLILAPVRSSEIFLARSLFAMSANALVAALFLTFVVGVGAGSGASPLFYVLALVLVAVQVLLITSLQATIMAAVLRWVPARIARDVAVAVASVTGAGLYLVWNITIRRSFTARSGPNINGIVSVFQRIEWVPSAWPGHALSSVIAGDVVGSLTWTLVTLAVTAAIVFVSAVLYERTLLAGLGLLGGVSASWRTRSARPVTVAARGGFASPELAIARKDWIAYRRDIRRLSRFLPAVIFLIAYGFVLVRPAGGPGAFWNDVFVIAFVSLFMSMMFATPSVPGERRGFLLLRLAPITYAQLIRAKVQVTLIPVVIIAIVLSVVSSTVAGNRPADTLQLLVLAIWLSAGCVCIGVAAGAIDPKFESTDDRRAVGVAGTFAALGAELGFGLLSVGAFALLHVSPDLLAGTTSIEGLPSGAGVLAAGVLIAILLAIAGAAVVALMLLVATWRLRSFEGQISAA
ncbi:MAG TPA: hypothetical protein VLK30_10760 [Candidatus Limnocylindrales bacterium]|nr:hypothetical protein [Candidatus Limnocylindrales bacterium]